MRSFLQHLRTVEKPFQHQIIRPKLPHSIVKLLWQSSLILPILVLATILAPKPVQAVSVPLDGTRTLISGTDCGLATYRLGTTATFNGKALDLLVEVVDEDNDYRLGPCVYISSNVLTVDMRDEDAGDNAAFMDLKITVVEKGTNTPLPVDRLTITGFDLDSNGPTTGPSGTGTDDIYLKQPDGIYVSSSSLVQYSEGSFFGGEFQAKLKGRSDGNCNDGPGALFDVTCRAGAIYINGAGGKNTVSSATVRLQNDNAYGDPASSANSIRRFQLSFEISEIDRLITNNNDYGDLPNSYGSAGHSVGANIGLGYGLLPDHEAAQQASTNADADDNDGTTSVKYDDEDAVYRNGQPLNGQTFQAGTTTNLEITTFGSGYLSGWIDLNRDGDFNDVGEKIISDRPINNNTVSTTAIPVAIPTTAKNGNSYMRFRFTTTTGVAASGYSASDGEVEDYAVIINNQPPETDSLNALPQNNPGGTTRVQVPSLAGSDPEDGVLGSGSSFRIITLPSNGTLYYNNIPVTAGQVIANYNPTLLTIDPQDGAVSTSFTYVAIDAAGQEDPTPATVLMPFTVPGRPNLLLVKRITAINGTTETDNGDDLSVYKDETNNPYDDNNVTIPSQPTPTDPQPDTNKWPTLGSFLLGGTNGGNIRPNDELDYTIYFLSTGEAPSKNALLCDRVPNNVTFVPTAFNTQPAAGGVMGRDRGILAQIAGVTRAYSNVQDDDAAQYFPPGVNPASIYPTINCGGNNTNGAIVVRLGDLPKAEAPGTPNGAYGWVRFRGRVK